MPLFVAKNGQTYGPHEAEEIAVFLETGEFTPDDFCWQEGWSEWRLISSVLSGGFLPAEHHAGAGDARVSGTPPKSSGQIPADIEIIGTLKLPDERTVTCRVEGEIHSPSTVIIPRENRVKARINAESVVIFGTVEGDIHATGRAILKSSSTLHGDIYAARVLVEEGATFSGRSHVGGKKKTITNAEPSPSSSPRRKTTSPAPSDSTAASPSPRG